MRQASGVWRLSRLATTTRTSSKQTFWCLFSSSAHELWSLKCDAAGDVYWEQKKRFARCVMCRQSFFFAKTFSAKKNVKSLRWWMMSWQWKVSCLRCGSRACLRRLVFAWFTDDRENREISCEGMRCWSNSWTLVDVMQLRDSHLICHFFFPSHSAVHSWAVTWKQKWSFLVKQFCVKSSSRFNAIKYSPLLNYPQCVPIWWLNVVKCLRFSLKLIPCCLIKTFTNSLLNSERRSKNSLKHFKQRQPRNETTTCWMWALPFLHSNQLTGIASSLKTLIKNIALYVWKSFTIPIFCVASFTIHSTISGSLALSLNSETKTNVNEAHEAPKHMMIMTNLSTSFWENLLGGVSETREHGYRKQYTHVMNERCNALMMFTFTYLI
jgi:hypothetical protein